MSIGPGQVCPGQLAGLLQNTLLLPSAKHTRWSTASHVFTLSNAHHVFTLSNAHYTFISSDASHGQMGTNVRHAHLNVFLGPGSVLRLGLLIGGLLVVHRAQASLCCGWCVVRHGALWHVLLHPPLCVFVCHVCAPRVCVPCACVICDMCAPRVCNMCAQLCVCVPSSVCAPVVQRAPAKASLAQDLSTLKPVHIRHRAYSQCAAAAPPLCLHSSVRTPECW